MARKKHRNYNAVCIGKKSYGIELVKTCNEMARQHWFSPDTMRFFNSKVLNGTRQGPCGVFFVTSEKGPWAGAKLWDC